MNKADFTNFIGKYNLAGICNQAKITTKDGNVMTSFVSDESSLVGFVKASDIDIPDATFGVYNTGSLLRILSAMQSEMEIDFDIENGKTKALLFKDNSLSSRVLLADLDIISKAPKIENIPETDVKITIDAAFIDKFLKAKAALPDAKYMAFIQKAAKVSIVINYAEHPTDRLTLSPECNTTGQIPIMVFNADQFKEILAANKDCTEGTIDLSSQGLMTVTFKSPKINCKYLLVMQQQED